MKLLTAIPVYNEERHLESVLAKSAATARKSSSSMTAPPTAPPRFTAARPAVITHPQNRGYGAALISAFGYAVEHGYDVLVTMDCDGQHEPARIPVLLEAIHDADIVSGSRYLRDFRQDTRRAAGPPAHQPDHHRGAQRAASA